MFDNAAKKSIFANLKFVVDVLSYLGCKLWIIQTKPTVSGESVTSIYSSAKKSEYRSLARDILNRVIGFNPTPSQKKNSSRPVVVV